MWCVFSLWSMSLNLAKVNSEGKCCVMSDGVGRGGFSSLLFISKYCQGRANVYTGKRRLCLKLSLVSGSMWWMAHWQASSESPERGNNGRIDWWFVASLSARHWHPRLMCTHDPAAGVIGFSFLPSRLGLSDFPWPSYPVPLMALPLSWRPVNWKEKS